MALQTALEKRCAALDIDQDSIQDVLSEPGDEGEVWIVKIEGELPYATIGTEFTPHVSYQEALDYSLKVLMSNKVLIPFGRDGKLVPGLNMSITDEPTDLLFLQGPSNIVTSVCDQCHGRSKKCERCHGTGKIENVPSLGDRSVVMPDTIVGFMEKRSGRRYIIVPATDVGKPITTAEKPLQYAGRFSDMVIFRAPASFLVERTWQSVVHRTMLAALKAGEVMEGLRPVLLPNQIKVGRLIPSVA